MKKRLHYSRLISLVVVMVLFINMKGNHLFAQVTPEDKAILLELYNATNGDSWTNNTNWGSTEPVSTWYGVTVLGDKIVEIDLNQNNLDGIIPVNLGQLTFLEYLKLDTNNISGNIPVELGNLAALQQLYLGGNQLNGSIPTSLRLLSNLRWLNLSDNQLSGEIPVELSELIQLEYLQLSKNQLTGNIPTVLGSMANLKWMNLSGNLLTGTIPTELGLLSAINFEQLYLNDNQLTGNIPVELWTLQGLKWLNLGQNQLTGTIPPVGAGQLTNLSLLYLDGNLLDGSIPETLDQITTLEWLNLGENLLTGNIPDEVWNITNLKLLYLNGNQLTGAVPIQINLLTELKFVDFDSNQLDAIPDLTALTNLTDLTISNNRFNFEHIEYNMDLISTVNFTYAPQDSIGQSQMFTKNEGETLSYTLTTGGSENSYQWYKDGFLLGSQISATLEINNLTATDAGDYYCEVTNALVPGLTLTSREVTLLLDICIQLQFQTGWNIFSSPVVPINADMKTIFQSLIDNNSLVKVQDENGNSLEYLSFLGSWANNIGDMLLTDGYKVKVSADDMIEICGPTVEFPYATHLDKGWNIISFPQTTAFNGKDVVQQLIDKDVLVKVQDEDGASIEYLSFLGEWKNSIGDFLPGKGYKVKVSADETLWIYNSYPKSSNIKSELITANHFQPAFEGNGVDHMNIYLAYPEKAGIAEGDEIGIFNDGICVGATKITNQKSSAVNLIASANDGSVEKINGFADGGEIQLKLFRDGKEYLLSLQTESGMLGVFEKNGSLVVAATLDVNTGVEIAENELNLNCYPNPFHDIINIEVKLQNNQNLRVEVYDMYSRKVRQLYSGKADGTVKLQWDGSEEQGNKVASGVYLLRVNKIWKKVMYKGN